MSFMDTLLGKPIASQDAEEEKIGPLAAVPVLGLDGLASAAYGPEAAMTVLIPLGAVALVYVGPIILILLALLAVLYISYRQTMAAYPLGGGSYTVSKENLGVRAGLIAAAALLLDYVLVAAVGISAGVGALLSAFPALGEYRLVLCLAILALITYINLRGVKESGIAFSLPTYGFIAALGLTIVIGLVKTVMAGGSPEPVVAPSPIEEATQKGGGVALLWLLMRAFASGCTAMTGVEAVSNGMGAFRKPAVPNAQATLTIIVGVLALLLAGIAYLAGVYHIGATPPEGSGYDSVLSQLTKAITGGGWWYYSVMLFTLAVLALSANTGFADFPRLCRLLAEDDHLPHAFANRGRRLVYTLGIGILATLCAVLLIAFGGVTDRLIPLFAVGAFGAFTLSQAGMVVYWKRNKDQPHAATSLLINGLGAVCTGVALVVVLVAKFVEGAWVTLLLMPVILGVFYRVHAHYVRVAKEVENPGALDVSDLWPPVVVLPVKEWDAITERALRFALRLSPDVVGVHVSTDSAEAFALQEQWREFVTEPATAAGLNPPRLAVVSSPYRRLFNPLLDYINFLKREIPENRQIAVVIPELVESHWSQYLLHNQRATGLKAALLLRGDNRVVVINVPWYLETKGSKGK
ncbi:MAG: APC family permease [Armatimonadetes bacterium]|nr:APC family permease [Armatimonadota bacterium]